MSVYILQVLACIEHFGVRLKYNWYVPMLILFGLLTTDELKCQYCVLAMCLGLILEYTTFNMNLMVSSLDKKDRIVINIVGIILFFISNALEICFGIAYIYTRCGDNEIFTVISYILATISICYIIYYSIMLVVFCINPVLLDHYRKYRLCMEGINPLDINQSYNIIN